MSYRTPAILQRDHDRQRKVPTQKHCRHMKYLPQNSLYLEYQTEMSFIVSSLSYHRGVPLSSLGADRKKYLKYLPANRRFNKYASIHLCFCVFLSERMTRQILMLDSLNLGSNSQLEEIRFGLGCKERLWDLLNSSQTHHHRMNDRDRAWTGKRLIGTIDVENKLHHGSI